MLRRRRAAVAGLTCFVLCAIGCRRSRLSEDEARQLLETSFANDRGARCQFHLSDPLNEGEPGKTFADFTQGRLCADALAKAGLLVRGECLSTETASGCRVRRFEPAGGAKSVPASRKGDFSALTFECGKLELLSIDKRTDEPNDAVIVDFTRRFTDGPVVANLRDCDAYVFWKPKAGLEHRSRRFTRAPDGKWVSDVGPENAFAF